MPTNASSPGRSWCRSSWRVLLVIAVAVLIATGAGSATRTWADVSIIWLIAPMLIFALFFVFVLGFLIYGIAKLLQVTPRYTGKAQEFLRYCFPAGTRKIADGTAKPFVWFQQAGAILKSIFKCVGAGSRSASTKGRNHGRK